MARKLATGYIDGVLDSVGGPAEWAAGVNTSNDSSATLFGSIDSPLHAGEVLAVYRNGVRLGLASISGLTWRFTDSGLQDGNQKYTVCVEDAFGNRGDFSGAYALKVDTVAPPPPVLVLLDDVGPRKGVVANGLATDDSVLTARVSLVGAEAGSKVQLYNGQLALGPAVTVTAQNVAAGYVDVATPKLENGATYVLNVRVIDVAGNASAASRNQTVIIETGVPAAPQIQSVIDDAGTIVGAVANGGYSDDTQLTVRVGLAGAKAGSRIQLYDGAAALGSAVTVSDVQATTGYIDIVTPSLVSGRSYALAAKITGAAGAVGLISERHTIKIDTGAPLESAVITDIATQAKATASVKLKADVDAGSPAISGTLSSALKEDEFVAIYRNGLKVGTANVNGTTWVWRDNDAPDGTSNYCARVQDSAGNQGKLSAPFQFSLDRTAPTQGAEVTGVAGGSHAAAQVAPGGHIGTNDLTVSGNLSGPLDSGDVVGVYRNGMKVGNAEVGGIKWAYVDHSVPEGEVSYSVRLEDAAGNRSAPSSAYTVRVDTSVPVQPTLLVMDDAGARVGIVANGESTDDTRLVLRVSLNGVEVGAKVQIFDGANALGSSVSVKADDVELGYVDVQTPVLVDKHGYAFGAVVTDLAGNASPVGGVTTVTVDTSLPMATAAIERVWADNGTRVSLVAVGGSTKDATPTLTGAIAGVLDGGEVVVVYRNDKRIGEAVVKGGAWSFTDSSGSSGAVEYAVKVEDAAGNQGAISEKYALAVDPAAIDVLDVLLWDSAGSFYGTIDDGGKTDATVIMMIVMLTGSQAKPGCTIQLYDGNTAIGDAVVVTAKDVGGAINIPTPVLQDGTTYTLSADLRDPNGRRLAASVPRSVTIDTVAPETPSILQVLDDVGVAIGSVANGGLSNDTQPTVRISLEGADEGGKVKLFNGTKLLGEVSVTAADVAAGYVDVTTPVLAHGLSYALQASVTDAAGNASAKSSIHVVKIDTVAPTQAAAITAVSDNAGAITGVVVKGGVTDDVSPSLKGTVSAALGAGEVLAIYRNGKRVGEATVSGTSWMWSDSAVADGDVNYVACVEDLAGNQATGSSSWKIKVDTTAPETPRIIQVYDDVGVKTGVVVDGFFTNDTQPTVRVSLANVEAGGKVQLYNGDMALGAPVTLTAAQVASGFVDITTPALAHGTAYLLRAKVTDLAGNASQISAPYAISIDAVAPQQRSEINSITDNAGDIRGIVSGNGATDDTTPTLAGTVSAPLNWGEVLAIYRNGQRVGETTFSGTSWSWSDSVPTDGTASYLVRVEDAVGNQAPASNAWTLRIDTTAPETPRIAQVYDDVGVKTGVVANGGMTNDIQPTVRVSLAGVDAGGKVQLYDGDTVLGAAVTLTSANVSAGYVDITTPTLKHGMTYALRAKLTDLAGNGSEYSDRYVVTLDTQAPTTIAAISAITDDVDVYTGVVTPGAITNDPTPTLSGTLSGVLASDEVVAIYRNNVRVGEAAVTGTTWKWTDSVSSDGGLRYVARVEDRAGNQGPAATSEGYLVILDTKALPPTIGYAIDDQGIYTGKIFRNGVTDDTRLSFRIYIDGNASIDVRDQVELWGNGKLLSQNSVSQMEVNRGYVDLTVDVEQYKETGTTFSFSTRLLDGAGNFSAFSTPFQITVDDNPPDIKTVVSYVFDNVGPNERSDGVVVRNGSTNDSSPQLRGEIWSQLAAGESVMVYRNGSKLGQATVNGQSWTYLDNGVPDGLVTYTAMVVDAAGNSGPAAAAFNVTVDTKAPAQSVVITTIHDDVTTGSGIVRDVKDGGTTRDFTPTLIGTLSAVLGAGETVVVYRNGVEVGKAVVDNLQWTFTDQVVTEGKAIYTALVRDAAFNAGAASEPYSVTVDKNALVELSVVLYDNVDNAGNSEVALPDGASSDDTQLTVRVSFSDLAAGTRIQLYDGAAALGPAVTLSSAQVKAGVTDISTPVLGNNTSHVFRVEAVDGGGAVIGKSNSRSVNIDTIAPVQSVTITSISDDVGSVTGPVSKNGVSDDISPMLSGTISAPLANGDMVGIYRNGQRVGVATVKGTSWTWADSMLPEGKVTYFAQVVDAADNQGPASPSWTITVDTTASAKPGILQVYDDVGVKKGVVANGGVTNDIQPTVRVSLAGAEAGGKVQLYDGDAVLGAAVTLTSANVSAGYVDITTPTLEHGMTYALRAKLTDLAGNGSEYSDRYVVTLDTQAPTTIASISAITDDVEAYTGIVPLGGSTNDPTPTLSGTLSGVLASDEVVAIYRNDVRVGEAAVTGTTWKWTDSVSSDIGLRYFARVEDRAGNQGPVATSEGYLVIVDTIALPPTIGYAIDDQGIYTGKINQNGVTDDTRLSFRVFLNGNVRVGDQVELWANGKLLSQRSVSSDLYVSRGYMDLTAEVDQYKETGTTFSFSARLLDVASNTSAFSTPFQITVDDDPPDANVIIYSIVDDELPDVPPDGLVGRNETTDDRSPTLHGGITGQLDAGDAVWVYRNDVKLGQASIVGQSWSYADHDVPYGSASYTAKVVDAAGNSGAVSNPYKITIEPWRPKTFDFTIYDDAGHDKEVVANGGVTDDMHLTMRVNFSDVTAKSKLDVYDGTTVIKSVTLTNDDINQGFVTIELPTFKDQSTHTLKVKVTDAYNHSAETDAHTVNVNLPGGAIDLGFAILGYADGIGTEAWGFYKVVSSKGSYYLMATKRYDLWGQGDEWREYTAGIKVSAHGIISTRTDDIEPHFSLVFPDGHVTTSKGGIFNGYHLRMMDHDDYASLAPLYSALPQEWKNPYGSDAPGYWAYAEPETSREAVWLLPDGSMQSVWEAPHVSGTRLYNCIGIEVL